MIGIVDENKFETIAEEKEIKPIMLKNSIMIY